MYSYFGITKNCKALRLDGRLSSRLAIILNWHLFLKKQIEEQTTECETKYCSNANRGEEEEAICVYENAPVIVENQVLLPDKENDFEKKSNQVEVSPGAATASGKICAQYDD